MTPSEKRKMKSAMADVERQITKKNVSMKKFEKGSFVYTHIEKEITKLKNRLEDLKACYKMDFFTLCERTR